uniref:receptor protein serine/threonine kinase n=1 Tax=Stegastes partitus TaxID=144197 RepID=A0A3B5B0G5_9TELE
NNKYLSFFLFTECICLCISSSSSLRRCVFQVTSPNYDKYAAARNVNGSIQLCENTHCCVGYYVIMNGQPKVDYLACDSVEKSCPSSVCETHSHFNNRFLRCVCNTDLCNSNIIWTPESEEPPHTYTYPAGMTMIKNNCLVYFYHKNETNFHKSPPDKPTNLQSSCDDYSLPSPCSCQTVKSPEIDFAHIELQQIVGQGHFATVFQGKYKGSVVAVKVLPADWKPKFITEKEIYELPLMTHAGIVHFLGTGRKPDDNSCFIVLQFAEYGSLHSFLSKHTTSWMSSLKLCQSLAQGLSYLHSDLHSNGVHKPPVAHSDLSSSNVLVTADGTCVLCDFGCSTILRSWSERQELFKGHAQLGTLQYMSPEILEGSVNLNSSEFLMQADVYALGLLLWEIWMRCSDLFEGGIVPQHLVPYELELGANVTLESLISYVSHKDNRPSIPKHWQLLPQGSALEELLENSWDCEPDARLTAHCVVDRLVSIQSSCSL